MTELHTFHPELSLGICPSNYGEKLERVVLQTHSAYSACYGKKLAATSTGLYLWASCVWVITFITFPPPYPGCIVLSLQGYMSNLKLHGNCLRVPRKPTRKSTSLCRDVFYHSWKRNRFINTNKLVPVARNFRWNRQILRKTWFIKGDTKTSIKLSSPRSILKIEFYI